MAKKEIRTKYIKSLMEDKDNLAKILEESTKDSLDSILDEKVNRSLRQMLAESDDSFTVEEVDPEEPALNTDSKDTESGSDTEGLESSENTDGNNDGNCQNGECNDGGCCDDNDAEGDNVWNDVEDCKDEDGEYDLRGKDINTVLKVLQSMEPEDGVRIIKNDDGTATVEPDGDEQEFVIDIEDGEDNANSFEDSASDMMDANDGLSTDDGDDDMMDDIDLDGIDDNGDDDIDLDGIDDDGETTFELEIGDGDDDEDMVNEGNVNLGYTDNYQKKTPMTLPSDKGEGEGDSRFDAGAPKGGANNKKRWVGSKGANGGNPYSQKTKQPMSENMDECGANECGNIYEVELEETHTRGMARKHNSVGRKEVPNTNVQSEEEDTRNIFVGAEQKKNTSRANESKQLQAIKRQANAILAENKELKDIAAQIKEKLNEAVIINSSLAKVIKLVTENSTTRDEKINILNRFNKVNTLSESKALYNQISGELQNAHSVNKNMLNNTLTEAKGQNKNMIVETNMLNQSEDLKEVLDLQKRLMNIK